MRTLFDDQEPPSSSPSGRAESSAAPLAERLRPRSLDEVVGHDDLVGPGSFLRRAIEDDRVPSLVLWGPPGSGKTTIARILASDTASYFVPFSAVTSGIKEVKAIMVEAGRLLQSQGCRTPLFVDEIHRFNRAQQDAFLPYVESGEIILVGATTENPSFELNAALVSRCRLVVLEPLAEGAVVEVLRRALDDDLGLAEHGITAEGEALDAIASLAAGDARRALGILELAVHDAAARSVAELTVEDVRRVARTRVLRYDKSGEEHYNLISALHKSVRESDPDAALYWLRRMLSAGEDPGYLARRMVRMAAEDIGLADTGAVSRCVAAWDAYVRLGSPEGDLCLAQAAVDLAMAPKSDAVYRAWKSVGRAVADRPDEPVPKAIRNAPTRTMRELGYGRGYASAHRSDEGVAGLDCLPESLSGSRFLTPGSGGGDTALFERLEALDRRREAARRSRAAATDDD